MFKRNNQRLIIFFALFFLVFTFSACLKTDQAKTQKPVNETEPVREEYQPALQKILEPYWQKNDIAGIKDQILEIKVPQEYLDLHFQLVVAFDLLEQGRQSSDQAKVEEGLEKINALKAQYDWLE